MFVTAPQMSELKVTNLSKPEVLETTGEKWLTQVFRRQQQKPFATSAAKVVLLYC